jgi:hypothetical protein
MFELLDRVIALGPLDGPVSNSSVASKMFSASIIDAENFRDGFDVAIAHRNISRCRF